jgi:conjugal transfer pilus assembly protein TraU
MTHLRRLVAAALGALGLMLASPASADAGPGRCTGSFVNPITDICWSCLFPISVGGPQDLAVEPS